MTNWIFHVCRHESRQETETQDDELDLSKGKVHHHDSRNLKLTKELIRNAKFLVPLEKTFSATFIQKAFLLNIAELRKILKSIL